MAKKGMIEREKKRAHVVAKYADKRAELKERFRKATSAAEKLDIHRQIQRLPRDSSATRKRNRCMVT
ncbi:MAG: 30S ribosomal protein S14, partial [Waterburya sp.]